MRRGIGVLFVLIAALALPSAALGRTQTASSATVSATFTFTGSSEAGYGHQHLTISRGGTALYAKRVTSQYCGHECAPGAPEHGFSSVHLIDLESTGEPDVVLDLYTGGAHCCSVEQIFSFDAASGRYRKTERDFGDPGETIIDLGHDGQLEFLTADDAFAYTFTDYAASGLPIQILRFADRHFVDVTREFPQLIRADAKRWLRAFKRHLNDSVGLIAAWAADEYLLGHRQLVKRTLDREVRKHHLRSALGSSVATERAFVRTLMRFLRTHGYTR